MANMNVTYEELRSQANQLRQGQQTITETLQNLQTQVNNLVASGFQTDSASGAFQAGRSPSRKPGVRAKSPQASSAASARRSRRGLTSASASP